MVEVIIYTTTFCPFCLHAKRLLEQKGVSYREIDVSGDDKARERMVEASGGRRTVPQIFINGRAIGGYEELAALDEAGELDGLLGLAPE